MLCHVMETRVFDLLQAATVIQGHPSNQRRLLAPKSSTTRLLACYQWALAGLVLCVRSFHPDSILLLFLAIVCRFALASWRWSCVQPARGPGWRTVTMISKTLARGEILVETPGASATATGPVPESNWVHHRSTSFYAMISTKVSNGPSRLPF
jgi:hypothetical protein